MSKNKEKLICVGKITSAHGIRGAVKIHSYTEIPAALVDYSPLYSKSGQEKFDIQLLSINNEMIIAKVNNISDRNEAEKLRGRELYAERDKFPEAEENEFYYEDLKGMKVLKDGDKFGVVLDVHNYGAGDLIEIDIGDGKTDLFPFNRDIFPVINVGEGYMTIIPPEMEYVQDNDNDNDED